MSESVCVAAGNFPRGGGGGRWGGGGERPAFPMEKNPNLGAVKKYQKQNKQTTYTYDYSQHFEEGAHFLQSLDFQTRSLRGWELLTYDLDK